ncbi:hypothetical protein EVAR_59664_1 [Eumeta japonica]|uniref:Uncharacterized protein n=1 Tax=Eumeta variegata TaxID=151549 RepID=A0A4C1Z546_EUMVA|nr:hypothetical protein EVAR_59664_1 [Eumeta japonica]
MLILRTPPPAGCRGSCDVTSRPAAPPSLSAVQAWVRGRSQHGTTNSYQYKFVINRGCARYWLYVLDHWRARRVRGWPLSLAQTATER